MFSGFPSDICCLNCDLQFPENDLRLLRPEAEGGVLVCTAGLLTYSSCVA